MCALTEWYKRSDVTQHGKHFYGHKCAAVYGWKNKEIKMAKKKQDLIFRKKNLFYGKSC